MPIDYVCPHCHAKFFVDDAYRGQSGPCAECGKSITIPGRASSAAEEWKSEERIAELERRAKRAFIIRIGVMVLAVTFGVSLLYLSAMIIVPEIQKISTRRDNAKSFSNLQLVAKALNQYASEYGTYPPPAVTDRNGLALYSWRVLILPQLGYKQLYESFNLEESWDSPENLQLFNMMPEEYQLPGGAGILFNGETAVSLVTGPGTLFPIGGPMSPTKITDDPRTTLLVTEATRAVNTWTSPFDCVFTSGSKVGTTMNVDLGKSRSDFAVAISVDENLLAIPNDITTSKLRALITPLGNEPIDARDFLPSSFGIYADVP